MRKLLTLLLFAFVLSVSGTVSMNIAGVPTDCSSLGGDPDNDGVCTDGATYSPCDTGQTIDCDDNCPNKNNVVSNPNNSQKDNDDDGRGNVCDNCKNLDNFDQLDTDGDAGPFGDNDGGDACDPDDDNDGVPDTSDINDTDPQVCSDGDGDGCDECSLNPTSTSTPNSSPWPVYTPVAEASDGPDTDSDGLCDVGDPCPIDNTNVDANNDGFCELDTTGGAYPPCPDGQSSPGFCIDNCPNKKNAGQADNDGDGMGNKCDSCKNDPDNDIDGDSVCGDVDNCPTISNSLQENLDSDSAGDACDVCPLDSGDTDADGDGFCEEDTPGNGPLCNNGAQPGDACVDNCPDEFNGMQRDNDNDGLGNACDNCKNDANSDQLDTDGDADSPNDTDGGDVCDPCPFDSTNVDTDDDGFCDDGDGNGTPGDGVICSPGASTDEQCDDNCTDNANDDQADGDADSVGDVCDNCPDVMNADQDDEADGDGVGTACDNCTDDANPDQEDNDGDADTPNDVDGGDVCDPDDDNDGVDDDDDTDPFDPQACEDVDVDTCDDCSENGTDFEPYTPDITNDGPDDDGDGLCDDGDGIAFTPFTTHAINGPQTIFRQAAYEIVPNSQAVDFITSANLNLGANMVALDVKANGKILFAVESTQTVPNGNGVIKLLPGVIYRWTGTQIKVQLKPSTVGVALTTINALDQTGGNSYLFSVDENKTLRVDGQTFRLFPSQVWRLKPNGTPKLQLVQGFAGFGFDNVDGVDQLPDGRMAISAKENNVGYGIFHAEVYIWDPATDDVIESNLLSPLGVDDSAGFTLIDQE